MNNLTGYCTYGGIQLQISTSKFSCLFMYYLCECYCLWFCYNQLRDQQNRHNLENDSSHHRANTYRLLG